MIFRRYFISISILVVLLIILVPIGLLAGSVPIGIEEAVATVCGRGSEMSEFIIIETRLPALLTGLLSGAALSVAGLLMQTCFNNPLSGPSIMGISSG